MKPIAPEPITLRPQPAAAFSIIEILVVASLLLLIVIALMAVFDGTQRAFRSSVTQNDVQEGGRAAMDVMTIDLRNLTPSGGASNGPVNFFVLANNYLNYNNGSLPGALTQSLPGSSLIRTNLLNYFFILGRVNTKWTATGYYVDNSSANPMYPLYRFYAETNLASSPLTLYNQFATSINTAQWTNMSHIIDGVVHLTLHAYDTNGVWINDNGVFAYTNALNTEFVFPPAAVNGYGEPQFFMFSNTVPAAVELELGVLEDHIVQRAVSLPTGAQRATYLGDKAGSIHLFRQRVSIPNVDPTAYQ